MANPDKTSQAPLSKRQRLNSNTPPSVGSNAGRGKSIGGSGRGCGRGRGSNYYNTPSQNWNNNPNWHCFNKNSNVTGIQNLPRPQSPWRKEPQRPRRTPDTISTFSVMSICDSFGNESSGPNNVGPAASGSHSAGPATGGPHSLGQCSAPTVARLQLAPDSPIKRRTLSFANESEE